VVRLVIPYFGVVVVERVDEEEVDEVVGSGDDGEWAALGGVDVGFEGLLDGLGGGQSISGEEQWAEWVGNGVS
jgi:hypothetical protein